MIQKDKTEIADAEHRQFEQDHDRLVTVLESTPDFIAFADAGTKCILYINRAGRRMCGIREDEDVNALKITDFHPEWTNRLFEQKIIPTAMCEGIWKGECTFLDRNGREIPVSMVLMVHRSATGDVDFFSTISHDITEQKKNEEQIKSLNEQQQTIIDSSPAMIFYKDRENRFIRVNEALAKANGKSKKEMEGKTCWDLYPREAADHYARDDEEIIASGKSKLNIIESMETPNGTVWVRTDKIPYRESNGTIAGIIGFTIDITERKMMEAENKITLKRQQDINILQQSLLAPTVVQNKLKTITDGIVRIFDADFCRIWLIGPGDMCEKGCVHAEVKEGPHACRFRDKCLHLMASSGRYTHIDGKGHARVPFGCYKIGSIASGNDHKFLTNDVANDPRVHNHEWARELGLVSFAGYQIKVSGGESVGVLGLFAKHLILPDEDAVLDSFSTAVAFVTQQASTKEELDKAYAALENKVMERTNELHEKVEHLERFRKATIEREFRMKELRDEIDRLKAEKGK